MRADMYEPNGPEDVALDGRLAFVVDDDPLFRGYLSALLEQKRVRVVEAADAGELQRHLDREMPDCLLLDYDLVSENGLYVQERMRQRYPALAPVVMVTADESQRTAVRAFRSGIFDFVGKRGLRIEELSAAMRRAIARGGRDASREREMARLRESSLYDAPTGLPLRRVVEDRLVEVADVARRTGRRYGVAAFRLDRLDEVRDRFGVIAVDRVLRMFGQKLRGLARSTDLVGAFDRETCLYVDDSDPSPEAFAALVEQTAARLAVSFTLSGVDVGLGAVSARAFHPDDGATPGDLLARLAERIEEAMRRAPPAGEAPTMWVREEDDRGSPPELGHERRREPRLHTLKEARLLLGDTEASVDCTVRNLSSGGAGLRLHEPIEVPPVFRLRISEAGAVRRARKCWQLGIDLGVEFLTE